MSGTKGLHVRLSDTLHSALAKDAERQGISLNALIVRRLEGFVESDQLASTVDDVINQQDALNRRLERLERLVEIGGMQ